MKYPHHFSMIAAGKGLAQTSNLIGKANQRGLQGVGGQFCHLGLSRGHDQQRRVNVTPKLGQNSGASPVHGTDDNSAWVLKIFYR